MRKIASNQTLRQPVRRINHYIELLGRFLLCLAIFVGAFVCIGIFQGIRADRHQEPIEQAAVPDTTELVSSALNGNWRFADVEWAFRLSSVNDQELTQQLDMAPDLNQESSPRSGEEQDGDRAVFALVELMKAKQSEERNQVVYRIASETTRGVAFARNVTPKAIEFARLANRVAKNEWKLVEIRRTRSSDTGSTNQPSLLPVAKENKYLARRFDVNGVLCAELIELGLDFSTLSENWKAEGWQESEVRPGVENALAATDDADVCILFSKGSGNNRRRSILTRFAFANHFVADACLRALEPV